MMTSSSSGYTIVHKEDKIGLNAPQSLAPSTHLSAVATNTITASHILPHTIQTDPNRPSFQVSYAIYKSVWYIVIMLNTLHSFILTV